MTTKLTKQQKIDRTNRFVCSLLYHSDPNTGEPTKMKQGPILFTLNASEFVAYPDIARSTHNIIRLGSSDGKGWAQYGHYSELPTATWEMKEGHVHTAMRERKEEHGCTDALCRVCGG